MEHAPEPTKLRLDIPAGLEVTLDGAAWGTSPLEAKEVSAGEHALTIESPCGQIESTVEAKANETTVFEGVPSAELVVEARDRSGKRLSAAVTLGEWTVPTVATVVPACAHRMVVRSPGLGGFMEDIELKPGQALTRKVVLAPGPDMVRIHGGHFTSGPVEREREGWQEVMWAPNEEWDVQTFDMDRTEVTVAQYLACQEAGGCPLDREAMREVHGVTFRDAPRCNIELVEFPLRYAAVEGREEHPANCLGGWAALQYCKWAGKRLPTDVEWQFAAKSRKSEYTAPWGDWEKGWYAHGPDELHRLPRKTETAVPCSYPKGNSEQGICDLQGNVSEIVLYLMTPERRKVSRRNGIPVDRPFYDSYGSNTRNCRPLFDSVGPSPNGARPEGGFRCVRSVGEPQR